MIGDLADRPRAEADLTYLLARKEAALQAFKSAKSDEDANRIFRSADALRCRWLSATPNF